MGHTTAFEWTKVPYSHREEERCLNVRGGIGYIFIKPETKSVWQARVKMSSGELITSRQNFMKRTAQQWAETHLKEPQRKAR